MPSSRLIYTRRLKDMMQQVIYEIQDETHAQVEYFKSVGKYIGRKRLKERTEYDLKWYIELGYCNGIEKLFTLFDRRNPGTKPFWFRPSSERLFNGDWWKPSNHSTGEWYVWRR